MTAAKAQANQLEGWGEPEPLISLILLGMDISRPVLPLVSLLSFSPVRGAAAGALPGVSCSKSGKSCVRRLNWWPV